MAGTIYLRTSLKNVRWQVFLAKRENARDKALQTNELSNFWEEFFSHADAIMEPWVLIDG